MTGGPAKSVPDAARGGVERWGSRRTEYPTDCFRRTSNIQLKRGTFRLKAGSRGPAKHLQMMFAVLKIGTRRRGQGPGLSGVSERNERIVRRYAVRDI